MPQACPNWVFQICKYAQGSRGKGPSRALAAGSCWQLRSSRFWIASDGMVAGFAIHVLPANTRARARDGPLPR